MVKLFRANKASLVCGVKANRNKDTCHASTISNPRNILFFLHKMPYSARQLN